MGSEQFPAIRADRIPRLKAPTVKTGAVIYCRVSTPDQAKNFSLGTQEAQCKEYCRKRGYQVLRIFVEPGESAKSTDRPQFQETLKYCSGRRMEIGAVVVYGVNRFARNLRDHLNIREQLRKDDIRLLSVTQELDDRTAQGKLNENFLCLQSQYENDQRSETTIAAMKKAMEAGKWCHKASTGYINTDAPGGLSLDPKSAPLVLKAFEIFAEGKHSKKSVLEAVTEQGLRAKSGKRLSAQTFDKILRNPLNAGWITSSWGISKKGGFEPIVSAELFNRVQDRLSGKNPGARQTRSRENAEFPLRVFVRCAECGRSLTGSFSTGRKGKRYPYYCCHTPGCRSVKFGRDNLHHCFHQLLYSLLPERGFMPLFGEIIRDVWKQKHAEHIGLVTSAERSIAELEARDRRVIKRFIDEEIDKATYDDLREEVGTAINKARAQRAEILLPIEQVDCLLEFAEWMLERVAGIWNSASLTNKRRIQEALFPDGLLVSMNGFGTVLTPLFFKEFQEIPIDKSGLALQMIEEPLEHRPRRRTHGPRMACST